MGHLFLKCDFANLVWRHFPIFVNPTTISTIGSWFRQSTKHSSVDGLISLWYIWKPRNSHHFRSVPLHSASIHAKTLSFMHKWYIITTCIGCVPYTNDTSIWEPPSQGFINLNFEGLVDVRSLSLIA